MKTSVRTVFFGSTQDSVIVCEKLHRFMGPNSEISLVAVVTQPDKPVGRHAIITATPVKKWAEKQSISVLSFPSDPKASWRFAQEEVVENAISSFKADLIVSACFGQKIPFSIIKDARFGGLNVHPSILPRFRGADPVPWAIISGDKEIGVSVVTLSASFDQGCIIAQQKIPLEPVVLADPLRTELFTIGATLLTQSLDTYILDPEKQKVSNTMSPSYARKLSRQDGCIDLRYLKSILSDSDIETVSVPQVIKDRSDYQTAFFDLWRALTPWPGVWTEVVIDGLKRRLKLLSCHVQSHNHTEVFILDTIQLEGKKPVTRKQFEEAYFPLD